MDFRHRVLAATVLVGPVQMPLAIPAPAAATETFLGCPAGFGMVVAPDPRRSVMAASTAPPSTGQSVVVQCVAQQLAGPPSCPPGGMLRALSGPDLCRASQRRPSSGGGIADGTSNTVMANSTIGASSSSISDGTSNTASFGQSASSTQPAASGAISDGTSNTANAPSGTATTPASVPFCTAPAVLVVDPSGQPADVCMIRTTALPSERVAVTR